VLLYWDSWGEATSTVTIADDSSDTSLGVQCKAQTCVRVVKGFAMTLQKWIKQGWHAHSKIRTNMSLSFFRYHVKGSQQNVDSIWKVYCKKTPECLSRVARLFRSGGWSLSWCLRIFRSKKTQPEAGAESKKRDCAHLRSRGVREATSRQWMRQPNPATCACSLFKG